jgi:hypothetical protein
MAALVFLVLVATPGQGFHKGQDVSRVSPDKALRARVHTDANGESCVRIEDTRDGRLWLVRDDTSSDGAHGYGVVHSAWTADSQFFVASLESSGGHQPWVHPIWVYSRASNQVVKLSSMSFTVVADFQLRSPDILKTRVLSAGHGRRAGQPLAVSLRTLLAAHASHQ